MSKTWREKFDNGKQPIVKQLQIDYADMKAWDNMLISSPAEIAVYISKISKGHTVTMLQMRGDLAREHKADGTCPLTTGIFTRIVSEVALEDVAAGRVATPFWRVVDPESKLASKISCGPAFIRSMRDQELAQA